MKKLREFLQIIESKQRTQIIIIIIIIIITVELAWVRIHSRFLTTRRKMRLKQIIKRIAANRNTKAKQSLQIVLGRIWMKVMCCKMKAKMA